MTKDIYRQLQERLDLYSMGFPPTESGIEIKILTYLFTEPDANLFLALSPALEAPDVIADRLHAPREETAAHLEQMAQKGLLFRLKKGIPKDMGPSPLSMACLNFR